MPEQSGSVGLSMRRVKRKLDLLLVITWLMSVAAVVTLAWIVVSIIIPAWPAIQKTGFGFS